MMTGLLPDIRHAFRHLRHHRGFTAAAVLILALGIGATTAVFGLVDRILFRSLPYPHDNELVSVGVTAPIIDGDFLFAANYLTWRHDQKPFTGFTSTTGVHDCDLTDDHPVRLTCAAVAATFLPTFGIQPVLGRNFTRDEDTPQSPPSVLLTYGLWQSRFGGMRDVVGRTISLDGRPTRVLGVLPAAFEFPTLADVSLVVPQALDASLLQRGELGPVVRVFGRMKPGLTVDQAKAQLQPLFHEFVQSAPPQFRKVLRLQVRSIRDLQVHDFRLAAWLLLASALAVLLIACANVGNLVFAHSIARRHDFAVRSVLGARRARLFRQRITESLLLSLLGGAAGCVLADAMVRALVALAPAGIPRLPQAGVDGRVLLAALALSIAAGLAFGVLPALEKPRMQTLVAATVAGPAKSRLRQALIFAQVGMSFVLLASALLLLRSLINLQHQALGMNTQHVLTAELSLGQQKYPHPAEGLAFFEALEQKLEQLPGVSAAALSDSLPPAEPARTMPFDALEAQGQTLLSPEQGLGGIVGWRSVTPQYFSVLGIPLVHGRAFEASDRGPGQNSIVLNQALAQRLFPGEEPLGKIIRFHLDDQRFSAAFSVIGIVGNTRNHGLAGLAGPEYYMVRKHTPDDLIFRYPDSQRISVVLRILVQEQAAARELRDAVATLDSTLPVTTSTLTQSISTLAARPRFSAVLLSLFAAVALLLTVAGIYGLVSLVVSQRTQEIGIRMALGAEPSGIARMMVVQSSVGIVLGSAAGLLVSFLLSHWLQSQLFGIQANDAITLAAAVLLLLSAALLGAWIPARRAARIDPMEALRYE